MEGKSTLSEEELKAIYEGMTQNMQVSMSLIHQRGGVIDRGSISTGTGKYTTLAFMGVCNGLEKRGIIVKAYRDESAKRQGNHYYEITDLGRAVAAYGYERRQVEMAELREYFAKKKTPES